MSRCYSGDLRHMACQGLVVSFSMGEPTVFQKSSLAPFSQLSQWLHLRISILGECLHVVSLWRFF